MDPEVATHSTQLKFIETLSDPYVTLAHRVCANYTGLDTPKECR